MRTNMFMVTCVVYFAILPIFECVEFELADKIKQTWCVNFCQNPRKNCNCRDMNFADLDSVENITVNSPRLHCKQEDLLSFFWEREAGMVYFVELAAEKLIFSDVTKYGNVSVGGLQEDTEYGVRLWALSAHQIGQSDSFAVKTGQTGTDLLPVDEIFVDQMILNDHKYDAVVNWTASTDMYCFYDLVWFSENTVGDYKQVEIREPTNLFTIKIVDLEFDSNYSVAIMVKGSDWQHESNKTWMYVKTPSCLDAYNNLSICPPSTPNGLVIEEYPISEDQNLYHVNLHWSKPELQPDYYLAHFMNLMTPHLNDTTKYLNISGNATGATFENLELGVYYQTALNAWSKAGSSKPAIVNRYITKPRIVHKSYSIFKGFTFILVIFSFLIVFAVTLFFYIMTRHKRKRSQFELNCKYFNDFDQQLNEGANCRLHVDVDEWEMDSSKLLLQTVLGEGAFGVVRRALIEASDGESREVAIKMLKDTSTLEEVRQFHQEINLMKSVGSHPHLVSIIGCITKERLQGPLLIVEYCSGGDLQTYLRNAWDKLTNIDIACDKSGHNFSNKMYELQNEIDLLVMPKDLISFAHQISIGMEYLSRMRVVHRDLAARNVLVCENKIVKISDFGLSRDIYQDNVYCKTSGGKLPMRWMALESLTHQRYTTQSDVWSFGVLLWEIVTLGGNPYPGVSTLVLLNRLKSGYRMERPANCSTELYTIMQNCWKALPNERPSFAELSISLGNLLESLGEYLHLDMSEEGNFREYYLNPVNILKKN